MFKIYDEKEELVFEGEDIFDFIFSTVTDEEVIDFVSDCYPKVNIPIVGDMPAGEVAWKLMTEYAKDEFIGEYVDDISEMIAEEVYYNDKSYYHQYTIVKED
jgi:hypothetical protein